MIQIKSMDDLMKLLLKDSQNTEDLERLKEKLTKKELELRNRYDEDPVSVVKELFSDLITPLQNEVALSNTKVVLSRAMKNIDVNYEVNWDKDYPKILDEINNFSKEARTKNPEGTLLKACLLAGVAKKRKVPLTTMPSVLPYNSKEQAKLKNDEAKSIRDRITSRIQKTSTKKKKSFFGV